MKKKIMLFVLLVSAVTLLMASFAEAATFDQILQRWTKDTKYVGEDGLSNLEIKATYYSAEFVEAYVQSQAQKNLWTQQEADDYKYNFLGALRLNETIPIQIEFNNNSNTMYLGPFDIMVSLKIGSKTYKPVDYDKRFNFKFQGKKEGLVYFPRYDTKTGADLLKGIKSVTLILNGSINPTITRGQETKFMWDIANDDPAKLYKGKTATRMETDRLVKRLEKIRKDKTDLQKQIDTINTEEKTIQARLDELAKQ